MLLNIHSKNRGLLNNVDGSVDDIAVIKGIEGYEKPLPEGVSASWNRKWNDDDDEIQEDFTDTESDCDSD